MVECVIVESPRRHTLVTFVDMAHMSSRLIRHRQWMHKLDYHGLVIVHLDTGCGVDAKDHSGLFSDL